MITDPRAYDANSHGTRKVYFNKDEARLLEDAAYSKNDRGKETIIIRYTIVVKADKNVSFWEGIKINFVVQGIIYTNSLCNKEEINIRGTLNFLSIYIKLFPIDPNLITMNIGIPDDIEFNTNNNRNKNKNNDKENGTNFEYNNDYLKRGIDSVNDNTNKIINIEENGNEMKAKIAMLLHSLVLL